MRTIKCSVLNTAIHVIATEPVIANEAVIARERKSLSFEEIQFVTEAIPVIGAEAVIAMERV